MEYKYDTIIAGSRSFTDYDFLDKYMLRLPWDINRILVGGARGADTVGAKWARDNDYPVKVYKADWDAYGKSAGVIRNSLMASNAHALVAFWDGASPGTHHMIKSAAGSGLIVWVIPYRSIQLLEQVQRKERDDKIST